MINLMDLIYLLLPLLCSIVLVIGLLLKRKIFIVISFWISLITLLLHYQASGGEILGSYFNYFHAAAYSLNLIVFLTSIIYLLVTATFEFQSKATRYGTGLLSASLVTGSALLLINLWINANFIENRLPGTPILQVATFNKPSYCDYKYVFYEINIENQVKFMCPNHYGLIPSVGKLKTAPAFVIKQLPLQLQAKFQQES